MARKSHLNVKGLYNTLQYMTLNLIELWNKISKWHFFKVLKLIFIWKFTNNHFLAKIEYNLKAKSFKKPSKLRFFTFHHTHIKVPTYVKLHLILLLKISHQFFLKSWVKTLIPQ
jgi:hypothetical protein